MMHHQTLSAWPGVLEFYRPYMTWLPEGASIVTLQEGNTPLVPAPRLAELAGGGFELFLKYEGVNPTASFKDRGMTAAMTQAVIRKAKLVICASTGNTSASAAAYAGRAGLRCVVLLPHGKIALGKLAQARMYGAEIIALRGNFDDALRLVRELGARPDVEVVNSINPVGSRARNPPPLRFATSWAAHPTSISCPSVTRATSPPTGRVSTNITGMDVSRPCPRCADSKPPVQRRSSLVNRSPIRKRSRPPSASAIPPVGRAPAQLLRNRGA